MKPCKQDDERRILWSGGHKGRVSEVGNCRLSEVNDDLRVAELALYVCLYLKLLS